MKEDQFDAINSIGSGGSGGGELSFQVRPSSAPSSPSADSSQGVNLPPLSDRQPVPSESSRPDAPQMRQESQTPDPDVERSPVTQPASTDPQPPLNLLNPPKTSQPQSPDLPFASPSVKRIPSQPLPSTESIAPTISRGSDAAASPSSNATVPTAKLPLAKRSTNGKLHQPISALKPVLPRYGVHSGSHAMSNNENGQSETGSEIPTAIATPNAPTARLQEHLDPTSDPILPLTADAANSAWGTSASQAQPTATPAKPTSSKSSQSKPFKSRSFRLDRLNSRRAQAMSASIKRSLMAISSFVTWTIFWALALGLSGGLGYLAFQRLTSLPPVPDCQDLPPLAADRAQLYCAREAAESGQIADLDAAVDLVRDWEPDHPLHKESQELLTDWSESLLAIARDRIQQSDLVGAVDAASHIPPSSSAYQEAQDAIAHWQTQWERGETLYAEAQEAIRNQNWDLANERLVDLGSLENEYWRRQQADQLTQQILEERQGWQLLQQARRVAEDAEPDELGDAIALVTQISPRRHAWEAAEVDLNQWSQTLVDYGMAQWQQGNQAQAIAIMQQVPPHPSLTPQVQDLIRYSHAQQLASTDAPFWMPTLGHTWGLFSAIATAENIQPDSTLYAQAQADIQQWQLELEDVMQLQVANFMASLGSRQTLAMAIDQAATIESDRPRRVQAQTLVAHWQQEIERMEDQPYLDRAYRIAGARTVPAYQQAIAQARLIQPGRALRIDAQTAIAHWFNQIEIIEDQPLLDEAYALANANQLQEAIRTADRIPEDRELYDEAQSAILSWQTEIRNIAIAADRPVLNEAYGLAAQEWYTDAIDLASQIGRGSPLYGEAQGAIAQWEIEREAIWDSWDNESSSDSRASISNPIYIDPEPAPSPPPAPSPAPAPPPPSPSYDGYYSPNYRQ